MAFSPIAPSVKLDAVNELLAAIDQRSVSSLHSSIGDPTYLECQSDGKPADVVRAVQFVDKWTRQAQTEKDFLWNVDEEVTLTANGSGEFILTGLSVARITLTDNDVLEPVKVRVNTDAVAEKDGKIVNLTTWSVSGWGSGAIKTFKITYWLTFAQMPQAARDYVVARAKLDLLASKLADPTRLTLARAALQDAIKALGEDEVARIKPTIFGDVFRVNEDAVRPLVRYTPSVIWP